MRRLAVQDSFNPTQNCKSNKGGDLLLASDLRMKPLVLHLCLAGEDAFRLLTLSRKGESANFQFSFFVPVTSELIVLLKGKSNAKSWAYPCSLFFRKYGPLVSIAFLPLLVLFSVYFLQILKLSLADEFTQKSLLMPFFHFSFNYLRWVHSIVSLSHMIELKWKFLPKPNCPQGEDLRWVKVILNPNPIIFSLHYSWAWKRVGYYLPQKYLQRGR